MASQPMSSRADALSNIARILDAARRAFATGDGTRPLAHIAREAGVGIATLYRHFPNRESLACAVYDQIFATEIEPALATFADTGVSRPALLDVAERISDVILREPGLVASIGQLTEVTGELLRRSMETLTPILRAAQQAGNIRPDITPEDIPVLLALATTAFATTNLDRRTRRRYLSLLLDALNPTRSTPMPPR
ncbi:TetR/AcrR family transcriptional regulator [Amycolatopsis nalaikhensis]|uniref:Helix-turn-helix domain-containing protein n=1 Tax=Amycolatopsis nalaikhensis TaxID=715472 RepID=A0ABY8XQF8_9PSEU|nr:TetR/AcrR family transcriptional regulator [Amycolatopsis sp. 2-2]WIV57905.1 helix-turn-helix domain-containing protein [Amycolatopsis sp. 2-2]